MILILDMVEHILYGLLITGTDHDKTHSVCSSFTDNSRISVVVKGLLELIEDLLILGCHSNKTKTQRNAMHDRLLLTRVSVPINKVVDQILSALVLMDKTISEICTSTRVRRSGLLCRPMEVWVQNLKSILLVSTMNNSKGSRCVEPVPVRGLSYPLKVILKESVVGCVRIHHSIGPNSCSM